MRHILIVWEFGDGLNLLLAKAARLLRHTDARFQLVAFLSKAVQQQTGLTDPQAASAELKQQLQQTPLAELNAQLEVVIEDDIAAWLSRYCSHQHVDLVVKAGHRTEQLFYTPTDWQLIRQLTCPLLLTSQHKTRQPAHILAAVDLQNSDPVQQLLNTEVCRFAGRIAAELQAQLHLVQVEPVSQVLQDLDLANPATALAKASPALQARLSAFADELGLAGAQLHIRAGVVEQQIQQLARELQTELVVLGSIGRSGLSGILLGNTAEQVLQQLRRDVLVVKPA